MSFTLYFGVFIITIVFLIWWSQVNVSKPLPQCIFVLGPPGAGKGTQSAMIVKNHTTIKHYSVGDLLRSARSGSIHSALIAKHIKHDTIVPVQITMEIMKEAIQKDMDKRNTTRFLIDGFPRNQDNLDGWNQWMAGYMDLRGVILLTVDDDIAKQRVLNRMRDENDNNAEFLEQKLQARRKRAKPVIEYYRNSKLLYTVNANRNVNEVYKDIDKLIANLFY